MFTAARSRYGRCDFWVHDWEHELRKNRRNRGVGGPRRQNVQPRGPSHPGSSPCAPEPRRGPRELPTRAPGSAPAPHPRFPAASGPGWAPLARRARSPTPRRTKAGATDGRRATRLPRRAARTRTGPAGAPRGARALSGSRAERCARAGGAARGRAHARGAPSRAWRVRSGRDPARRTHAGSRARSLARSCARRPAQTAARGRGAQAAAEAAGRRPLGPCAAGALIHL